MKNSVLNKIMVLIRLIIIFIAISSMALLDPYFDSIDEGNTFYKDNKYTDADDAYNRALDFMPSKKEKPYIDFNRGAAQYKAGNFDGAVDYFTKALDGTDPDLQKRAFYNLGNSYYKKGDIKSALEHYINALRVDPTYDKPKQNIEALLKEQQNDKNKDNQNDQNNDQQNNQDDSSNEQDKEKKDEEDKNSEENKSSDADSKRDMDGHNKGESIEKKLSKEQIDNILNHFKQRPVQKTKGDGRAGRALEKNW